MFSLVHYWSFKIFDNFTIWIRVVLFFESFIFFPLHCVLYMNSELSDIARLSQRFQDSGAEQQEIRRFTEKVFWVYDNSVLRVIKAN